MSLTKEDLQAISDLIDVKLNEQDKRISEMIIANHVQKVVSESEKRLFKEIQEIRNVTAQNCYDIAGLKQKIS